MNSSVHNEPVKYPRPLIGFAAFSGTGKTTLLLKLIPLLKAAGVRLAVVKHAHHAFDVDQPGKDSYRLREAGADEMLVASRRRMAWIRENETDDEPTLRDALAVLDPEGLDLVLVEGFKADAFPKIELNRASMQAPLLFLSDPNIVAIATDVETLVQEAGTLPVLSINDPEAIAAFILSFTGLGDQRTSHQVR